MKRVVSTLSFFFFLLFTISTAHLTQILDHDHDLHIKSSADGQDSSKILLPTESSPVSDHTESSPVQEKQETQDVEIAKVNVKLMELVNRNPVQIRTRFYPYSFRVFRFNPRCRRHLHRFFRYPPRFVGVNEEGSAPVREIEFDRNNNFDLNMMFKKDEEVAKVLRHRHVARSFSEAEGGDEVQMFDHHFTGFHRPRHHHRHHHHDHDDHEEEEDQTVEMKTEAEEYHEEREEKHKNNEHETNILKNIRKFLGYF